MIVRLSSAASQDLFDGHDFYEDQAEGVGAYFVESMLAELRSLEINAGIHPIRYHKYYQVLTHRFPFAILYEMRDDIVWVKAILDCRRGPDWIQHRLK